ncbi:response regulator transcription factor [Sedimentimonas flavescens]|uniref:Response regulator transcription factor n=1 Tax=Sedimentimonas flavescens TaxID=2851012 RepID=A0ABT2ZYM5_9RHOB|nr:response regulator transcription factor [Sedimentimonas flavescens]MBW0158091.1 response regulator transcription factor [Sedimentimonas flavescens]MCT2539783.1 response regulator transcription factor [Sedimentimonas flavescens]MCV2878857.1 response regulator transcription factor [Sedimentimonas flavescens]WBL33277.1 response regulator transcription factor [Sinirhodobacter sp. HNIBRBA609]
MITVLIADDHEMVRDSIAAYLENEQDIQTEVAKDMPSALRKTVDHGGFDLVLLDYTMHGMNGLNGLQEAMRANGGRPVGLISGTATRHVANEALALGAAGFLPKSLSAKSLINAVRFMASGEVYAPFEFLAGDEDDDKTELAKQLTEREGEVMRGLLRGQSNKEIARDMGIQEVTVKLHVKTLCRKIGARNRTQAAIIAKEAHFH